MERGLIDGVLTTYETALAAGLDSAGITSVLEDFQYYPFYVPVASASFWSRIDSRTRAMLQSTWMEVVGAAREEAVRAQSEAKRILVNRGLRVYVTSDDERSKSRAFLIAREGEIAERLSVSAGILSLLELELEKISKK
jgi:TRAP-type C4-dicarboxylate transport system substrate-binding protein